MIGFLRFVGLMNAAVWFGSALFFMVVGGPALFSEDMRRVLGETHFEYFSGAIAQVLMIRFFHLNVACSFVALLHAAAEWLYLGRALTRFGLGLLLGLLALSLIGGGWMQPKIQQLHTTKHALNYAPEVRTAAGRTLRLWQGAAYGVNLLLVCGLGVYVWRVAHPVSVTRFVSPVKFQS